jgi:alpha-1,3/alpha-1,6-mannosyltransferase
MTFADAIAVNSSFTKSIVAQTWPRLARQRSLHVVYPCIDTSSSTSTDDDDDDGTTSDDPLPWKPNERIILSINRFERKKDVALALRAFALLPPPRRATARLLLAGGYDPRVPENVAYHAELAALADSLGLRHATARNLVSALTLTNHDASPASSNSPSNEDDDATPRVLFLLSVPNALKHALLRSARLLVYTPRNEHFGIVPLEAMLRRVPVLAADSGGPRETVVDGVTGWLRDPGDPAAWSEVMDRVLNETSECELREMGRAGEERVRGRFAEGQMAERLEGIIGRMESRPVAGGIVVVVLAGLVGVVGVVAALVMAGMGR